MMHREDTREDLLKRRARRLARSGDYRKAAVALREHAALTGEPAAYAALGDMLRRARRLPDAITALKQAVYLHRRCGASRRAQTVERMIVALDPWQVHGKAS